jgi:hypothetical protein
MAVAAVLFVLYNLLSNSREYVEGVGKGNTDIRVWK